MIDLFDEFRMVNAVTDGFPFVCPVCEEVHENWDYLRIYFKNNPNSCCIHLYCLLKVMKLEPSEIGGVEPLISEKQ